MIHNTLRALGWISAFLLCLSCLQTKAAQTNLTVGTASAAPGQKSTGFLEIPAGSDAATKIPVVVVNGSRPGPVLALVAGSHGTEYASIIALEELVKSIEPADLSGAVIIIPLVNLASFEQKVPHVNPVDNKSMNRFFPGRADGTQTERASWSITKEVIEKCDYLIDFHGGDLDENLRPYSYWAPTGNVKQDAVSRDMNLAFGLDIIGRISSLFKKGALQRELVDVNELIREMIVLLRSEASRYSISIRTELAEGLPKVMADRVQLQQVFMNLMLNGIDAMKETSDGSELAIKSEAGDGQLLIWVSDTGVGLPSEQADEIFRAFFTTKDNGTGMGLPISRSIIESHGGRLWATANAGPGATLQFTLPARVAAHA
jgi:predicted deacylase